MPDWMWVGEGEQGLMRLHVSNSGGWLREKLDY